MRAATRRKKVARVVAAPPPDAPGGVSIASTCKAAFAVFAEYSAQHKLAELKAENEALKRQLACYGTAVGCVRGLCSNCGHEGDHCDCKAWTCRCYQCWLMRRLYLVAHGTPGDFNMVDDSADDEVNRKRLARERAETDNMFDADVMDAVLNMPVLP